LRPGVDPSYHRGGKDATPASVRVRKAREIGLSSYPPLERKGNGYIIILGKGGFRKETLAMIGKQILGVNGSGKTQKEERGEGG